MGFGYNRAENASDYKSTSFMIRNLIAAVSLGGNLEMSLGPTGDGRRDLGSSVCSGVRSQNRQKTRIVRTGCGLPTAEHNAYAPRCFPGARKIESD